MIARRKNIFENWTMQMFHVISIENMVANALCNCLETLSTCLFKTCFMCVPLNIYISSTFRLFFRPLSVKDPQGCPYAQVRQRLKSTAMLVSSISSLLEVRGYGCLKDSQHFAHFRQRKASFIWSEEKTKLSQE